MGKFLNLLIGIVLSIILITAIFLVPHQVLARAQASCKATAKCYDVGGEYGTIECTGYQSCTATRGMVTCDGVTATC